MIFPCSIINMTHHTEKQKDPAYSCWVSWWRYGDSNPRPSECEPDALPSELYPRVNYIILRNFTLINRYHLFTPYFCGKTQIFYNPHGKPQVFEVLPDIVEIQDGFINLRLEKILVTTNSNENLRIDK